MRRRVWGGERRSQRRKGRWDGDEKDENKVWGREGGIGKERGRVGDLRKGFKGVK